MHQPAHRSHIKAMHAQLPLRTFFWPIYSGHKPAECCRCLGSFVCCVLDLCQVRSFCVYAHTYILICLLPFDYFSPYVHIYYYKDVSLGELDGLSFFPCQVSKELTRSTAWFCLLWAFLYFGHQSRCQRHLHNLHTDILWTSSWAGFHRIHMGFLDLDLSLIHI